MINWMPLLFLSLLIAIILLSWWKSNLLTAEDIYKSANPKAPPLRWLVGKMAIAKSKRKTIIELLGVAITIGGASLGLTLSFQLNDLKTKADNKARLLKVIDFQTQKQKAYLDLLNYTKTPNNTDTFLLNVAKRSEESMPFPYFSNLNDPAVYDIQWLSRDLLNAMDADIRSTFQTLNDGEFRHYNLFSDRVRFFDSVSLEIFATERAWQTGWSDSEYFREIRVLHDRESNYIDSNIVK